MPNYFLLIQGAPISTEPPTGHWIPELHVNHNNNRVLLIYIYIYISD